MSQGTPTTLRQAIQNAVNSHQPCFKKILKGQTPTGGWSAKELNDEFLDQTTLEEKIEHHVKDFIAQKFQAEMLRHQEFEAILKQLFERLTNDSYKPF